MQDSPDCVLATLTQLKALRLASCSVRARDSHDYTGPGLGNDMGVLPGLTKLQAVTQSSRGLVELQGFKNMQQVRLGVGTAGFARIQRPEQTAGPCTRDVQHAAG